MVYYPNLIGKMAKQKITKKSVAKQLGISERAIHNKLSGRVPFTWPEVFEIRNRFFPDMDYDVLFSRTDSQDSA